jgi:hypothetical protein
MNLENSPHAANAQVAHPLPDRLDIARALYGATAALLEQGQAEGFRFYALHLRVALQELETHIAEMGSAIPAPSRLPRKPASAAMRQLIRQEQ